MSEQTEQDSDFKTRNAMYDRRNHILTMLATSTFTPEQYAAIYEELAELALALGPDFEDQADAKLYQDGRSLLYDLIDIHRALKIVEEVRIERERRRWHPKGGDHAT